MRVGGRNVLACLLFLAVAAGRLGAEPTHEKPPDGMGLYVMALRDPGLDARPGQPPARYEEPDVIKLGGRVLRSYRNLRMVHLPLGVSKQLRRNRAILQLQRVWAGEPLETWNELDDGPPSGSPALSPASETAPGELSFASGEYAYDGSGNITTIGSESYQYDSAGRLIRSVNRGGTETYKYDSFGNLTERASGSTVVAHGVAPATNRLTGRTYDAVGNVTVDGAGREYEYDAAGMVVAIDGSHSVKRMIYTPEDERIATIGYDTTRVRVRDFGARVVREYKSYRDPNRPGDLPYVFWQRDYVYAEGALVAGEHAAEPADPGMRHYHTDHLGSVRLITRQDGVLISRHDFMPFGRESTDRFQEAGLGYIYVPVDPMKFTSHERDLLDAENVDTGDAVDYMHARYYDPYAGRFLSVDPVCGLVDRPQSWNRYAYALNNPLMYTDPTGRYPCKIKLTGQDAKDAGVGDGTEVDGECVDARDPAKEEEDKKRQQRPRPQVLPMLPFSPEPVRPDGPVTMLTRQLSDALHVGQAFLQNYLDMREAWTVGADRYFHCMANCKGARAGAYGSGISERFSNAREVWDQNVKRYPLSDSLGDQAANAAGRNGPLSLPCETVCAGFRPAALSSRY